MTRSDLDVGSSAMPIQTEGAKWIFNEDKVPRLSLQRLHNCKIFTEHFCAVWPFFTDIQPWAVRCPAGTHTHMPSEELSSTGESLHLRHLLLTVTDTSCHKTPAFFPCQPPRCLTDSLILHYILFCTSVLCASFPVFTVLSFLTSYFCLPAHLPPSCTAAEDIFSVHHYLWSLRSALLHRKTLQWNIHLLNLLLSDLPRLVYPVYVTCTCCSHVCTGLI